MFKKLKKFIDADPDAPKMGTVPLPEVEDVVVLTAVQDKPSQSKWRDDCMSDGELMTRPRKPSIVRTSTPAPRSATPAPKPVKVVDVPSRPAAPKASNNSGNVKNLHWLLLPYDSRISKGFLEYDFAYHIDRIRLRSLHGHTRPLNDVDLHKPAADERVTQMTITCAELPWWHVRVRRPEGVRIVDVLDGIHQTYYRPLTEADKDKIGSEKIAACEGAFRRRCRAAPALDEWEHSQGMRRVDLLRGKTMFLGLIRHPQSGQAGDLWLLYLGKTRDPELRYASGRPVY
ncbi:hypothetical protein NEOLEDRAFT_543676 [Neolentinus lepideus HHB14362 ss-1]|uniref:DUF6699 domain-containing protein n=1 Tax=Neolentinus lepideus HHB14362 ss-1 TaxID=1314782 RepID=A0A165R7E0_9AGAM|nr:hypothetical protein NEOLEDRAFT_543676 [Neolentinus lepideus HHB14362 ss-1]